MESLYRNRKYYFGGTKDESYFIWFTVFILKITYNLNIFRWEFQDGKEEHHTQQDLSRVHSSQISKI